MVSDTSLSIAFNIIASLCGWGAIGMGIAGIVSQEWEILGELRRGLWDNCAAGQCFAIKDPSTELQVTRAFMIMFAIILLCGNLLNVYSQCKLIKKARSISGGIFSLAAIFAVIGTAVYKANDGFDYGTGYILSWAVVGMCFAGGLLQQFSAMKMNDYCIR